MADDIGTVTVTEYARSRGVGRRAIQQQVESGVIRLVNGRVDPIQADSSWGVSRRGSRGIIHQNDDIGRRSARAKVALTLARLRMLKHRYAEMRESYVDRAEAVKQGEAEARYVLDGLKAAPAAYAETLAAELAISPEKARRILDRFIAACLIEIGDLPRQAIRDAERA
jgi:hypothetical protein